MYVKIKKKLGCYFHKATVEVIGHLCNHNDTTPVPLNSCPMFAVVTQGTTNNQSILCLHAPHTAALHKYYKAVFCHLIIACFNACILCGIIVISSSCMHNFSFLTLTQNNTVNMLDIGIICFIYVICHVPSHSMLLNRT